MTQVQTVNKIVAPEVHNSDDAPHLEHSPSPPPVPPPRTTMIAEYGRLDFGVNDYAPITATNNNNADDIFSFGWSDFPVIEEGATIVSFSPSLGDLDFFQSSVEKSSAAPDTETLTTASNSSLSSLEESSSELLLVRSPARNGRTTNHNKRSVKSVRFSNVVEVRTHETILGDHPFCLSGMALSCGWRYLEEHDLLDLDVFEQHSPKRRMARLRLNYSQRLERLEICTGLTSAELLRQEYDSQMATAAAEQHQRQQQQQAPRVTREPERIPLGRPLSHTRSVTHSLNQHQLVHVQNQQRQQVWQFADV